MKAYTWVVLACLFYFTKGAIDLTCDGKSMRVLASATDFPSWAPTDIKVGTCSLNADYSLSANIEKCGVHAMDVGDKIVIKSTLLSSKIKELITRKKPVEYLITCVYDKITQTSSHAPIKTILGRIGGLVTRQARKPVDASLFVLNKDNTVATGGKSVEIPIGTPVTAVLDGPHLEQLGVRISASDCFVSPDPVPTENSLKYFLLRDMCPKDQSFKIENFGRGQKMTFNSFTFTKDKRSLLYLHCDVLACKDEKTCGVCVKEWKQISSAWIKAWNNRKRVAMVFDVNTYQTLNRDNIRCNKDGMKFMASQEHFPNWKASDIKLGTCSLNDDFTLNVSYKYCGIPTRERRHQILMETMLIGKLEDNTVTRKRPIRYIIRCGYDRFMQETSQNGIEIEAEPEAQSLRLQRTQPSLYLHLLNEQGLPLSRNTLEVDLNDKVSAVIGGDDLQAMGLNLYASDCFVTPDENPNNPLRYDLMRDSCIVDKTFSIKTFGNGQKLSFDTFAFTKDVNDSKLYLHCDVRACFPSSKCGICLARKRRSTRKAAFETRVNSRSIKLMSIQT